MGLDFRIDEEPVYYINGELSDRREAMGLVEDPYDVTERTTIELVPQDPLPENRDGLDDWPHWSYGGFMRFRVKLAAELGINLRMMWGFMPEPFQIAAHRGVPDMKVTAIAQGFYDSWCESQNQWWRDNALQWEDLEPNPIYDLLSHSDCDGDLSAEQCAAIAPVLRESVKGWPQDDYDRKMAEALANAMELCASVDRRLIFC